MSYEEILETSDDGRFRVKLVADENPEEPYDCSQSPLIRMDYRHGWVAEHIQIGDRPTDADDYVETAAQRCGTDFTLLTRYLIAYHGVTKAEWWHSGSYWYITYDSAAWREWCGAPEGSADMSEYRAWCEGDVWGYVVEKLIRWTTEDGEVSPAFRDEWDHVDSCWGFYGSDGANGKYLRETALEALRDVVPFGPLLPPDDSDEYYEWARRYREIPDPYETGAIDSGEPILAITAGPEADDV